MTAEERRLDEHEWAPVAGEDVLANGLGCGTLGGGPAAKHDGDVTGLVAAVDQAGVGPLDEQTLVEATQDMALAAGLDTLAGSAKENVDFISYPAGTNRRAQYIR